MRVTIGCQVVIVVYSSRSRFEVRGSIQRSVFLQRDAAYFFFFNPVEWIKQTKATVLSRAITYVQSDRRVRAYTPVQRT